MDPITAWVLGGLAWSALTSGGGDAAAGSNGDVSSNSGDPVSPAIVRVAQAIARAEGFYASGSNVPKRNHNPGDLKIPGSQTDASGHTVFASDAEGWAALYRQLARIVAGTSAVYRLDMTIAEMGARYAPPNAAGWAANVAGFLGVSTATTLAEVLS